MKTSTDESIVYSGISVIRDGTSGRMVITRFGWSWMCSGIFVNNGNSTVRNKRYAGVVTNPNSAGLDGKCIYGYESRDKWLNGCVAR